MRSVSLAFRGLSQMNNRRESGVATAHLGSRRANPSIQPDRCTRQLFVRPAIRSPLGREAWASSLFRLPIALENILSGLECQ